MSESVMICFAANWTSDAVAAGIIFKRLILCSTDVICSAEANRSHVELRGGKDDPGELGRAACVVGGTTGMGSAGWVVVRNRTGEVSRGSVELNKKEDDVQGRK